MGACPCKHGDLPQDVEDAAARLSEMHNTNVFTGELQFPMYVVPLEIFMGMTLAKPFEVLLQEEALVKFEPHMGEAIFVSHQWAGRSHPDPDFRQLSVLQAALANMSRKRVEISASILSFVILGERRRLSSSELRASPLFIWYDYFCCPQLEAKANNERDSSDLQRAIDSIPGYVFRAKFFFVLAPVVEHVEEGTLIGKWDWRSRGWCRVERVAREFQKDSRMVYIDSAEMQQLMEPFECMLTPAGKGEFSVPSDRARVLSVMTDMLQTQLLSLVRSRDIYRYRFLLNWYRPHLGAFCKDVRATMSESSISTGESSISTAEDSEASRDSESDDGCLLDFMQENLFSGPWAREFGWTPVCFAALRGDAQTLKALLDRRADVNERVTEEDPENHIHRNMSLLHICAQFSNNQALQLLIERKADVDTQSDEAGTTPLHRAGIGDNPGGVLLLLRGGCNPHLLEKLAGVNALYPACAWGSRRSLQTMLEHIPGLERRYLLHFGILGRGNTSEIVASVVGAGVDINEQFRFFEDKLDPIFAFLAAFCRRIYGSKLCFIIANTYGATPLMCSLLTCHFEATCTLLEAGADVNIRNACGLLPIDLAGTVAAPECVLEGLQKQSNSGGSRFCRHVPAGIRDKLSFSI